MGRLMMKLNPSREHALCACVSFPCPRSQTLRSATSPPSPLLRYRSIHRRCRGSSMASSSSKGGGGGSPANSSSSIYPASFIKRNLVPGADSYRQTLAALRDMDEDAVAQRAEHWRMEDALVEKASKLLTSKDTSPEDIQAFLSSPDFTELSTTQQQINDVRTRTLRLAKAAYDRVDASIRALDWDISMLEPQMAAAVAEDFTLDPQILAIKRKEQRKAQRQEKQRAKEMASKMKKKLGKGGKDTSNDLGFVPSVGQGQGTPGAEEEVDPNEPVYCTCQRVSYGQMVGCDDDDCNYEWFHLDCVGLLALPPATGGWLCPDCCVKRGLIYQGAATAIPPPPATVAPVVAVAPMEEEQQQEEQEQEQQEQMLEGSAEEAAAMVVEEAGGEVEEGGGGGVEEEGGGEEEAGAPVVAEEAVTVAAEEEGVRDEEGAALPTPALEGEAMS